MKQGTIKTLGTVVLGAAAVVAGAGSASAESSGPLVSPDGAGANLGVLTSGVREVVAPHADTRQTGGYAKWQTSGNRGVVGVPFDGVVKTLGSVGGLSSGPGPITNQ